MRQVTKAPAAFWINQQTEEQDMTDEPLEVEVNCPDRGSAMEIARACVDARLAACATVSAAVESVYHWKGAIESAPEVTLRLKSRSALFDALTALIVRHHPYDLPAIVALPVAATGPGTLDWLRAETGAPAASEQSGRQ